MAIYGNVRKVEVMGSSPIISSIEKVDAIDKCFEYQDYLIQQSNEFNKYHHSTEGINPRDSRPVVIIENSGTKDDLVKKIISIINESSSQNYDNSESSM